jgi:ribosomal protein L10
MKFELKDYKLEKTKRYFQKTPAFLVFNVSNLNSKNWLEVEQTLFNYNLKYYKICNTLAKKFIKKSIFKNICLTVHGFTCFVHFDIKANSDLDPKKIKKLSSFMTFLGLKFNQNFYSLSQLDKVSTLNYKKNINIFNNLLKKTIKLPYYKLNK